MSLPAAPRPYLPDLSTRAGLARAITLVESSRPDHQAQARALLQATIPKTGRAQRIGVTGVPGVGKSTFIDSFGSLLTGKGKRLAVLAVDPTSRRTGGSILGDKTRMARLSMDPNAFIRPSPAGDTLGGVTRRTREAMLLCEAAGHDVILVETVGVGQSETAVADMVDVFLVLMLPNAGDELQGIKKGVLEIADLIAVNKADIDPVAAERAVRTYATALHLMEPADPDWTPPVIALSGQTGEGLERLWTLLEQHRQGAEASGARARRRVDQQLRWLDSLLRDGLVEAFGRDPETSRALDAAREQVRDGRLPASVTAHALLETFLGRTKAAR
jgi:LAO/AO transport system kinase